MRHQVPGEAQGGAGPLVLASMSGAPMLATKRYTLTEMNLWLMGDSAAAHGNIRQQEPLREGERGGWLGYDVSDSDCALYRQRRSLKSALLMAQVLRRSLLLPKFCSHTDGGRTVPMSFLFDYERFAAQFPEHAEASALRYFKPGPSLTTAQPPPRFHIALHDASGKKSAEELNVDGSFKAKSPKGASEGQIHTWLKRWQTSPLLWFDKIYQRFNRLDNVEASNLFDVKMRDALRPAPELRAVIDQILNSLKRDVLSGAGFNCLQVSQGDLTKNQAKVFTLAGRVLNSREPTLLVDASLAQSAREHMRNSFRSPLFLDELLPNGTRSLFVEAFSSGYNLGFEVVEMHVCAAADDFGGNMLTPYAHAVCGERDGVLPSGEKNCAFGAKDCAFGSALSVKDGHVRKQCRDLYSRDADTIKASRVGRGWF